MFPCYLFGVRLELIDDDGNFYVYTDIGHKRDGVWTATGELWQKGVCIMQFNRSCPAGKTQVRLPDQKRGGKAKKRRQSTYDWLVSEEGARVESGHPWRKRPKLASESEAKEVGEANA